MFKMIELSQLSSPSRPIEKVYLYCEQPLMMTTHKSFAYGGEEMSFTRVYIDGHFSEVIETPEEILKLLEKAQKQ